MCAAIGDRKWQTHCLVGRNIFFVMILLSLSLITELLSHSFPLLRFPRSLSLLRFGRYSSPYRPTPVCFPASSLFIRFFLLHSIFSVLLVAYISLVSDGPLDLFSFFSFLFTLLRSLSCRSLHRFWCSKYWFFYSSFPFLEYLHAFLATAIRLHSRRILIWFSLKTLLHSHKFMMIWLHQTPLGRLRLKHQPESCYRKLTNALVISINHYHILHTLNWLGLIHQKHNWPEILNLLDFGGKDFTQSPVKNRLCLLRFPFLQHLMTFPFKTTNLPNNFLFFASNLTPIPGSGQSRLIDTRTWNTLKNQKIHRTHAKTARQRRRTRRKRFP